MVVLNMCSDIEKLSNVYYLCARFHRVVEVKLYRDDYWLISPQSCFE